MSWSLLLGAVSVLGVALVAAVCRRVELARMRRSLLRRERAAQQGTAGARLQHPVIDLSRCLGCGTCVAVCPEEGVLDLVHGQAMVVNEARCVGVAACERECPVNAISVTLGDVSGRDDIPAITEGLEANRSPGLFLAGEVTAHALIKTAVEHGVRVAQEVARRIKNVHARRPDVLDLVVVGAGPAGLACSLEARLHGIRFLTLDQEQEIGGTIAKYPRRKLVITQPVEIPLYGRLKRRTYSKEQLIGIWREVAGRHQLPIVNGEVLVGVDRDPDGGYEVRTENNVYRASHVCLALGRRGIPRKLGVPGEELPKVAYGLLDANSYRNRRVLVVGGGDSAVEAALALAEQPGNQVTLSYRKGDFVRIRERNEKRLAASIGKNRIATILRSEVLAIHPDSVDIAIQNGTGTKTESLPNDDVFVMAGGTLPTDLLRRSGISFEPQHAGDRRPISEGGTGLIRALTAGFLMSIAALYWAWSNHDYYGLSDADRPTHAKHALLRPGMGIGLWLGIASVALILVNVLYLARRSPRIPINLGSLRLWMTSHVATGVLAFLCAVLHGAMAPRETPAGNAMWALAVLMVSGGIGRYLYAYVPRAANGGELELDEVKAHLGRISEGWDEGQRRLAGRAREEIDALVDERWKSTFVGRLLGLLGVQRKLRRALSRLAREGRREGVAAARIRETLRLARRAHRAALMVAHYEDLRAILNSWRWVHCWFAAIMLVLVAVHVVRAIAYGAVFFGAGAG